MRTLMEIAQGGARTVRRGYQFTEIGWFVEFAVILVFYFSVLIITMVVVYVVLFLFAKWHEKDTTF